MQTKNVSIEIRADRIDIAVWRGGRAVSARRIPVDLPGEFSEWMRELERSGDQLKKVVAELEAGSAKTIVLYAGPSLAVDTLSVPVRSRGDAERAAELACLDTVSYAEEATVTAATVVACDHKSPQHRSHVVAAVERDRVAAAIADLIRYAGLRLDAIVPIDAPIIAHVLQTLEKSRGSRGALYFGEYTSFFAVVTDGVLQFARRMNLGLDTMLRGLMHEVQTTPGGEPISIDRARAATLLREHGIPQSGDLIDEDSGLTGGQMLPLLQPVLQRLAVEIRQSLRFGLEAKHLESLSIELLGPGGQVARLDELFREELQIDVHADAGDPRFDWAKPASPGSDHACAMRQLRRGVVINLLPRAEASRRFVSAMRRLSWAGAAAAVALLVLNAVRLEGKIMEARRSAEGLTMRAESLKILEATRTRLVELSRSMTQTEALIARELKGADSFEPLLQEMSLLTPEHIRLTSLSLGRTAKFVQNGSIGGYAFEGVGLDADTALSRYLVGLGESPLIDSVTLRTVHDAMIQEEPAKRFEIDFSIIGWPSPDGAGEPFILARGEDG